MWPRVQGRGHGMYNNKTTRLLGVVAAAALIALLTAPIAHAAPKRPLFIGLGANSRAPIGWIEFCAEHPHDCESKPLEARDVVLTSKAWKDLQRINKWVNDQIRPMTDYDHWGVAERWSYPDDGYGDCEDYV